MPTMEKEKATVLPSSLRAQAKLFGINTGEIARDLGYSREYGYAVLAGRRTNPRITSAILRAIQVRKDYLRKIL